MLGIGHALSGTPDHQRLRAVADHSDVVGLVRVFDGVGVGKAERFAQTFDVVGCAGQERPARADVVRPRVACEHHRRVLIGRERDGVEEDVPADPIAEELLDLDEVRGGDGARAIGAGRVHEIDDDLAVFDQVLVEADRLAVVGDQGHVREMVALEPLSRIHARPGGIDGIRPWPERIAAVGVRAGLPGPGRDPGRDGPQTEGRQSRPSCHR